MPRPVSTSQKHRNFVSEPIAGRSVMDVPGVGPKIGSAMRNNGTRQAEQLLGEYLANGRDPCQFRNTLESKYSVSEKHSRPIHSAMSEYSNNFL